MMLEVCIVRDNEARVDYMRNWMCVIVIVFVRHIDAGIDERTAVRCDLESVR